MKTLHFLIKDNTITPLDKPKYSEYSECKFSFSGPEWNDCKAVAVFERSKNEYPVAISQNGVCEIPNDLLSGSFFRVRVVKVKDNIRTETNTILITKEV